MAVNQNVMESSYQIMTKIFVHLSKSLKTQAAFWLVFKNNLISRIRNELIYNSLKLND